ncbi:MAG: bifunctional [glutamate--ammonia ligase]-adenylyl-L-tyrosine phosphorylase/[glutamate--ammonia-ligase] adenylyltransferase [candidate division NC10 bacterium]|nr:bifunctional [glutamate--ammonia ligase]-adenylyl-L-tyrosine phosphorylase/[glutamate--ammonia-ligase] adenylyltransferase [candidate division NC10 bacterium]
MTPEHLSTLLSRAGLKDLKRAEANLELLAQKGLSREAFDELLPHLLDALPNAPDPDMALNNLERYTEAVVDRGFFYSLLARQRRILDVALTIFGGSQFLSDILARFPQDLYWLLEPGVLRKGRLKEELSADLSAMIDRRETLPRKFGALRRFKLREILRIGLQDLVGNLDLAGVTVELSNLAEVCLQKVYEVSSQELERHHGIPRCEDGGGKGKTCGFAVIGMGKLGGQELNFSSDIDLLFVYEAEGETTGVKGPGGGVSGRVSNHQFFTRLAELLIKAIGEVTAEGHVFRVDLRLRPQGTMGELVSSLQGYERYYESWGRAWERLALIKARPVAGDSHVGQAFLEMVAPFVYRDSLDFTAIDEITALKERVNQSIASGGKMYRHVKLGYGGIREIEFVVQAFQLLYGGRDLWLKEPNTFKALHRLRERRHLHDDDYATLVKAYTFLRTVEHRLQILHQRQTHTLPEGKEALTSLARRLGYRGEDPAETFLEDYRAKTGAVHRMYEQLLQKPSEGRGEGDALTLFLEADLPSEPLKAYLREVGVEDPERAFRTLMAIQEGPSFAHHAGESRRAFSRLAPRLLQALKEAPDPDLALIHIERFITNVGVRSGLLSFLAESPGFLSLLIRLFGLSEPLSEVLILHPDLLDLLVDPEALRRLKGKEEVLAELREAVGKAPGASGKLDALRRVKKVEELRLGLHDLLDGMELPILHRGLTGLAEACLQVALEMASRELTKSFGPPPGAFAMIGVGKLGGGEMGYGSDLDILFVYNEAGIASPKLSAREYFAKLSDRVTKILTTMTAEGSCYKVDPRLRPGGQKGELAQPLTAYEAHFASSAEVWERQAYLKARPVAGDGALGRRFVDLIHPFLFRQEEPLAARIVGMRRRIEEERVGGKKVHVKLGSGGLVEVEFAVQFLQLKYGQGRPELWEPNTLSAIEKLERANLFSREEARRLQESYLFLRRVEERLRIAAGLNVSALPESREKLRKLAKRLGYQGSLVEEQFLADYAFHAKAVHGIYERYLLLRQPPPPPSLLKREEG